jgi:hypothetical protein
MPSASRKRSLILRRHLRRFARPAPSALLIAQTRISYEPGDEERLQGTSRSGGDRTTRGGLVMTTVNHPNVTVRQRGGAACRHTAVRVGLRRWRGRTRWVAPARREGGPLQHRARREGLRQHLLTKAVADACHGARPRRVAAPPSAQKRRRKRADSPALPRPRAGHGRGSQSGRLQGLSTQEGTDEPWLPSSDLHGKEGVCGSSPQEGLKYLQISHFCGLP